MDNEEKSSKKDFNEISKETIYKSESQKTENRQLISLKDVIDVRDDQQVKKREQLKINISQLNQEQSIKDENDFRQSNLNISQRSESNSVIATSTIKKPPLNTTRVDQKKEQLEVEGKESKEKLKLSKEDQEKMMNSFNIFDQHKKKLQNQSGYGNRSRMDSGSSTNSSKILKIKQLNQPSGQKSNRGSEQKIFKKDPLLGENILQKELYLGKNHFQQQQVQIYKNIEPPCNIGNNINTPKKNNLFNNFGKVTQVSTNNIFQQNNENITYYNNQNNNSLEFNFTKNDIDDAGNNINYCDQFQEFKRKISSITATSVSASTSGKKSNEEIKCNKITIVINNSTEKKNNTDNNNRPSSAKIADLQISSAPPAAQTQIQSGAMLAKQLKIDRSQEEQRFKDMQTDIQKMNAVQDQYKLHTEDVFHKQQDQLNEYERQFERLQLTFLTYKKECDIMIFEKDQLIQQLKAQLNEKNDKMLQLQYFYKQQQQSYFLNQLQINQQHPTSDMNQEDNKIVQQQQKNNIINPNSISSNINSVEVECISPIPNINQENKFGNIFNLKDPVIINKRLNLDADGIGDDDGDYDVMQSLADQINQGLNKNTDNQNKNQIRQNYLKKILGELEFSQICEIERIFDEIMRDNKSIKDLRTKYSHVLEELIRKLHMFKDKHTFLQSQLNELQQNCVRLHEENLKNSGEYKIQMQKLNELKENCEKVRCERNQTYLLLDRYEKKEINKLTELQMEYHKKEEEIVQCQQEVDQLKNQIDQLLGIVGLFDSEKELVKQTHNETIEQYSIVLTKYDDFIIRLFSQYCGQYEQIASHISSVLSEIIINVSQKEILDKYENIKKQIANIYNQTKASILFSPQGNFQAGHLHPVYGNQQHNQNFSNNNLLIPQKENIIGSSTSTLIGNNLSNQIQVQNQNIPNNSGIQNSMFLSNNGGHNINNKSFDYQQSYCSLDKNSRNDQIDDDEDGNLESGGTRRSNYRELEQELSNLKMQLQGLEKENQELINERKQDYGQMKESEKRFELFRSKLEQKIIELKNNEKQFIQMIRQIIPEIDLKEKDDINYFEIKNAIVKRISQDINNQQQSNSSINTYHENQSDTLSGVGVQKYLQELNNSIQQIKQISFNTNQILSNTNLSGTNPVTTTNFLNTEKSFVINSPNNCNCFKGDKSMNNQHYLSQNMINPSPLLPNLLKQLNNGNKSMSQQNFYNDQALPFNNNNMMFQNGVIYHNNNNSSSNVNPIIVVNGPLSNQDNNSFLTISNQNNSINGNQDDIYENQQNFKQTNLQRDYAESDVYCPLHQNLNGMIDQTSQYSDLVATTQQQQCQINILMNQMYKSLKLICDLNDRNILEDKKQNIENEIQNQENQNNKSEDSTFYIQIKENIIDFKVEELLKKKYEEYDKITNLIEQENKLKQFETDMNEYSKILTHLENQLSKDRQLLEEERIIFESQKKEFEIQSQKLKEEINYLQQEYKEKYDQYQKDFKNYENLMIELKQQKGSQDQLQQELVLRSELIKDQQEKLDKYLINIQQYQNLWKEMLDEFESKKDNKNQIADFFEARYNEKEQEIKSIREKYEEIQKLSQELKLEKEFIKVEHQQCSKNSNELEKIKQKQVYKTNQSNTIHQKEIDDLNKLIQEKCERIVDQKELIKNLNSKIEQLETQLDTLYKKYSNFDEINFKYEAKQDEINTLTKQIMQEQKERMLISEKFNEIKQVYEQNNKNILNKEEILNKKEENIIKKEESMQEKINSLQLQIQNDIKQEQNNTLRIRDEYQQKLDDLNTKYLESSNKSKEYEKNIEIKEEIIKQITQQLEIEKNSKQDEKKSLQSYFEEQFSTIISHIKEDNETLKQEKIMKQQDSINKNQEQIEFYLQKDKYLQLEEQEGLLKKLIQQEINNTKHSKIQQVQSPNSTSIQLFEILKQSIDQERLFFEEQITNFDQNSKEKDQKYFAQNEEFQKYKDQINSELLTLRENIFKNQNQADIIAQQKNKLQTRKEKILQLKEKICEQEKQYNQEILELERQKHKEMELLNNKISQSELDKLTIIQSQGQIKNDELTQAQTLLLQKIQVLDDSLKLNSTSIEKQQNQEQPQNQIVQKKKIKKSDDLSQYDQNQSEIDESEDQIQILKQSYLKLIEQSLKNQQEQQQEMKRQYGNIEEQIRENLEKQMQIMKEKYERSLTIYDNQIKEEQLKYRELRQSYETQIQQLSELHSSQEQIILQQSEDKVELLKSQIVKFEDLFKQSQLESKEYFSNLSKAEIGKEITIIQGENNLRVQQLEDKLNNATQKMQDYENLLKQKDEQSKQLAESYEKTLLQTIKNDISGLEMSLIQSQKQGLIEFSEKQNNQKEMDNLQEAIKLQENSLKQSIQLYFDSIKDSLKNIKDQNINDNKEDIHNQCIDLHSKILVLLENNNSDNIEHNITLENQVNQSNSQQMQNEKTIKILQQKISEQEVLIHQISFKNEGLLLQLEQIKEMKKLSDDQKNEIILELRNCLKEQANSRNQDQEKNKIQQLYGQIEELRKASEENKIKLFESETSKKFEIQLINEKKKDLEKQLKEKNDTLEELKSNYQNLKEDESDININKDKFDFIKSELESKQKETLIITEEKKQLQEKYLTEKLDLNNKLTKLKEEYAVIEEKLKQQEEKSEVDQDKLKNKKQKIKQLTSEVIEKSDEIIKNENDLIKLQTKQENYILEIQQLNSNINTMKNQIDELKLGKDHLEEQKSQLREQLNTIKENFKHSEGKYESLLRELEQLKEEKSLIQNQSSEKIKKLNDSMVTEFSSQNVMIENLKEQINKLTQTSEKQNKIIEEVDEIHKLKTRLSSLEEQNQSLQQQIFRMQEEKEQLYSQNNTNISKLEEQRKEFLTLTEDNGKNKELIRSLEEKIIYEQQKLQREQQQYQQIKSCYEQAQTTLENTRIQSKELEVVNQIKDEKIKQLTEQIQTYKNKNDKQKETIIELKQKNNELDKSMNLTQNQIKNMQDQLNQAEIDKMNYKEIQNNLQKKICELEQSIHQLKQQNDLLQTKRQISQENHSVENTNNLHNLSNSSIRQDEYDTLLKQLEQKNKEILNLEQKFEQEQQKFEQSKLKTEEKNKKQLQALAQKHLKELEEQENQCSLQIQKLKEKHDKNINSQQQIFEEEKATIERKQKQLKEKLNQLEEKLQQNKSQYESEKQKLINIHKDQVVELENEISNLSNSVKKNLEVIKQQEETISEKSEKIVNLEKSLKSTQADNEKILQDKISLLNTKINDKENQINNLDAKIKQITSQSQDEISQLVKKNEEQVNSLKREIQEKIDLLQKSEDKYKEFEKKSEVKLREVENTFEKKLKQQQISHNEQQQEKDEQISQQKEQNKSLEQKLQDQQKENEKQIKQFENDIISLKQEKEIQQKTIQTVQQNLNDLQNNLKAEQKNISDLQLSNQELLKVNSDLQQSQIELEKTKNNLLNNIDELEKSNSDLSKINSNLTNNNETLLKANQELQKSIQDLQKSNEDLLKINQDHQNAIKKLQNETEDLQNTVQSFKISDQDSQNTHQGLISTNQNLIKENQQLLNQIQELNQLINKSKSDLQVQQQQHENKLAELQNEQLNKIEECIKEKQNLIQQHSQKEKQLNSEIQLLQNELQQIKKEIQDNEQHHNEEQTQHKNKLKVLETQLGDLKVKLKEKEDEITQLQTSQNASKEEKIQLFNQKIKNLENEVNTLNNSISNLEIQKQQVEQDLKESNEKYNKLEQKYNNLNKTNQNLDQQLKKSSEQFQFEKENLISQHQEEISQHKKQITQLTLEIQNTGIEIKEKAAQIERQNLEHTELKKQLESLQQKFDESLKQQNKQLEDQISTLYKASELERQQAANMMEQLKKQHVQEIEQLKREYSDILQTAQQEYQQSKEEANKLKSQYESLKSLSDGSNCEIQKLIDKMRTSQEENNQINLLLDEQKAKCVKQSILINEMTQKIDKLENQFELAQAFVVQLKQQDSQCTKSNFNRLKKLGLLSIDIIDGFLTMYQKLASTHSRLNISSQHHAHNFNSIINQFKNNKKSIISNGETLAKQLKTQLDLIQNKTAYEISSGDAMLKELATSMLEIRQVYTQLETFHDNIKLFLN